MAQPPNPRAQRLNQRIARWNQTHPASQDIDPDAALRVAGAEGLSGAIGDDGHAFGDFQLNDAGGVLTGKFNGRSPQWKQAWASSPAGIDYALAGIAKVAGGRRGRQAVETIVRQFERPADPNGEIARALGGPGFKTGSAAAVIPPPPAAAAAGMAPQPSRGPDRMALVKALMGASQSGDYSGFFGQVQKSRQQPTFQPLPAPAGMAPPVRPLPASKGSSVIAELLHEGVGGPTHSTGEHIHVALRDAKAMLAAIQEAQRRGLSVRENPYTDPVDPVHSKNSFHYQTFPGMFGGKKLGEAADVSGPGMGGYEQWVRKTFGGR